MEIIVVLIIIGVVVAFSFPNYTTPIEKARVANARNNLLAIYSAEQNYSNNHGSYCFSTSAPACDTLADINTQLSLNIQDDGTYTYSCSSTAVTCTATRTITPSTNIVVTLNSAINLSGSGTANPLCNTSNNWCP
jgi:Tfp pilus assembly protein PilE